MRAPWWFIFNPKDLILPLYFSFCFCWKSDQNLSPIFPMFLPFLPSYIKFRVHTCLLGLGLSFLPVSSRPNTALAISLFSFPLWSCSFFFVSFSLWCLSIDPFSWSKPAIWIHPFPPLFGHSAALSLAFQVELSESKAPNRLLIV